VDRAPLGVRSNFRLISTAACRKRTTSRRRAWKKNFIRSRILITFFARRDVIFFRKGHYWIARRFFLTIGNHRGFHLPTVLLTFARIKLDTLFPRSLDIFYRITTAFITTRTTSERRVFFLAIRLRYFSRIFLRQIPFVLPTTGPKLRCWPLRFSNTRNPYHNDRFRVHVTEKLNRSETFRSVRSCYLTDMSI